MKKILFLFAMVAFLGTTLDANAQDLKIKFISVGTALSGSATSSFRQGNFEPKYGAELALQTTIGIKNCQIVPYVQVYNSTFPKALSVGSMLFLRLMEDDGKNVGLYFDANKRISLAQSSVAVGAYAGTKHVSFAIGEQSIFFGSNSAQHALFLRLLFLPGYSLYQK